MSVSGKPTNGVSSSAHMVQNLILINCISAAAQALLVAFQVFCEEAGSDAGYFRQFVAASYGRFWARYAPRLGQRPHCYEVGHPVPSFTFKFCT